MPQHGLSFQSPLVFTITTVAFAGSAGSVRQRFLGQTTTRERNKYNCGSLTTCVYALMTRITGPPLAEGRLVLLLAGKISVISTRRAPPNNDVVLSRRIASAAACSFIGREEGRIGPLSAPSQRSFTSSPLMLLSPNPAAAVATPKPPQREMWRARWPARRTPETEQQYNQECIHPECHIKCAPNRACWGPHTAIHATMHAIIVLPDGSLPPPSSTTASATVSNVRALLIS